MEQNTIINQETATFKDYFTRSSQGQVFIRTLLESPYRIFAVVITLVDGYDFFLLSHITMAIPTKYHCFS